MPVLSKFNGIVIRMLLDRTFGMRLHAFYGDTELVIGLNPVRAIQGDVPAWVRDRALEWAAQHAKQLYQVLNVYLGPATPVCHRPMQRLALQN